MVTLNKKIASEVILGISQRHYDALNPEEASLEQYRAFDEERNSSTSHVKTS